MDVFMETEMIKNCIIMMNTNKSFTVRMKQREDVTIRRN